MRAGAQTPTAVYQTNQHIMMVNHAIPMPYAMPQGPQYCIPQYRHSAPPYVGPPQQYPVQPPGPSPFYPGPGPGDFPTPYGAPFYSSQPVYQSAPIPIVPPQQPQQPPPPAKREKKTIRIRDPNQGGRDITEEIMSGGGSRNPTPPILRPSSTPTPPQHRHTEEKPKLDPVLKSSPSAPVRAEPTAPGKCPTPEPIPEPAAPEVGSEHLLPPGILPGVAAAPVVVAACHLGDTSEGDSTVEECASPDVAITEDAEEELCTEPLGPNVAAETPVTAQEMNGISYEHSATDSDVGEQTMSGEDSSLDVPELIPAPPVDTSVHCTSPIVPQTSPLQPETPPPPLISAAQCTMKTSSPAAVLPSVALDHVDEQEDGSTSSLDGAVDSENTRLADTEPEPEPSATFLGFTSRKSPVEAQTAAAAPKMWQKPKDESPHADLVLPCKAKDEAEEESAELEQEEGDVGVSAEVDHPYLNSKLPEENGETEPLRNGADTISEGDGGDAPPGTEEGFSYKSGASLAEQQVDVSQDTPAVPASYIPHEGKRQYDRDFLLGFQFMPACVQKPEGLPPISDVVLDKINQPKLAMRTLDARMLQKGPDFTPAYADFGRLTPGGRGVPLLNVGGPRRSQPGQRREPRKIIMNISVTDDVHLKKSENAWKPSVKRDTLVEDPETIRTQALFRKVRSILNKLTPQMFNQLMKQVTDLTVDTEERLKGVIDLVFEKAIDEPSFSVAYANMCRCLATLKVPMADKPGSTVNFRKLLLNRCQKEFEKDKADDDVFEKKQKELELATTPEEKTRLQEELEESRDKARRRSIGNIKFIGELFKLKMLTEAIMHDCVVKLLKNHDEESLECLCRLLTTIGKDLDFEKAKPRMDQYFHQMEKIVKERKTSSRIRFMLQDVIDLRLCNWVSRRADQGPKTIEQIHKEAKIEEQEEQRKVQQLMTKEKRRPGVQRVEEGGWNTVQGAKNNRVLDPTKFLKITKPTIDEKIQLVPKAQPGSWGKGSSGGAKTSETESLRPGVPSLNRFSALQPSVSSAVSSPSSSDLDNRRMLTSHANPAREKNDKPATPTTAATRPSSLLRGSSTKELIDNQEEVKRETLHTSKALSTSAEQEKTSSLERKSKEPAKNESTEAEKSPMSEEELERKSKAIIDEFLHINDYKEAMQCVEELGAQGALSVFVRVGVESTLERSQITRDHMGQLLYHLVQSGKLSKQDFYTGFSETLELADDMAIDIPHIWLYLAELVTPMLKEGGIALKELITEFNKALLPVGRGGGVLLSEILHLLCKQMSHKKVAALWRETGLRWKELLPEGEDVQSFVSEKNLDFTLSDCSSPSERKEMTAEELNKRLEQLITKENASDEHIFDWVEVSTILYYESTPGVSHFLHSMFTGSPYRAGSYVAIYSSLSCQRRGENVLRTPEGRSGACVGNARGQVGGSCGQCQGAGRGLVWAMPEGGSGGPLSEAKNESTEAEKSPMSEEELERKSKAIIDEFLHINDYKEAMQCVEELGAQGALSVFVRVGVESTLERSQITRDHMGQLLYHLVQSGKLSKQDFYTGFSETLELADDMAIDIPHIWLYLAELVTPMLKEGGIALKELITEFNKALLPVGRGGGVLLSEILHLLCKQMSHKKVAALWRETGLRWKELLPEGEDVQSFVSEKNLDFTLSDCSSPSERKEMTAEELNKRLEQLITKENASDEHIFDWVEANLDESQMTSPTFLRALMMAVCRAAIVGDFSSYRVDTTFLKQKVPVLVKYMDSNVERELQALYALQALIVKLDQPPNLLRMFFDCLYDEEVISEDAFYRWESSKDPAEQNGKGVALKSVTAFFTWLREAEEESEDN
ncbi:eukaryotic translation initiation factor 4 gamma 3-like [Pyxicephalus adspersus]|uniref:eukaryotic translation initiation factor 4 gamma 3-like n=1 Tax=Pyxicephalus adspersus TaxID=30357 RepID=UPI003B597EA0